MECRRVKMDLLKERKLVGRKLVYVGRKITQEMTSESGQSQSDEKRQEGGL